MASPDVHAGAYLRASSLTPHMDPEQSVLENPHWKTQCFETCQAYVVGPAPPPPPPTGGSLRFNAEQDEYGIPTSSWLVVPNNGSFAPSGRFTVEWFQNMTDVQPFSRVFSINNGYFSFYFDEDDSDYRLTLELLGNAYRLALIPKTTIVGQWNFFAIQRNFDVFSLYMNGSLLGSVSAPVVLNDTVSPLYIGQRAEMNGASEGFDGFITNFNWVNASFSVNAPTRPIETTSNTYLLLRASFENAPLDDSGIYNKLVANFGVLWLPDTPF